MIGDFNSRPANENAGPCLRFHLSFLRFRLFGRPPSTPLELIPAPFGSRWSLSGHIRYIRLGTRATVTLESATRSNLLVQEFSGSWRTPQGTIPRARLEALDGPRSYGARAGSSVASIAAILRLKPSMSKPLALFLELSNS